MTNKHKYADMIIAKAENMDLVVFSYESTIDCTKWFLLTSKVFPAFNVDGKYFLCLPQHQEACLHWLNGGEILIKYSDEDERDYLGCVASWSLKGCMEKFTDGSIVLRIKPRKEKRWIAVNTKTGDTSNLSSNEADIRKAYKIGHWQIIEIEVEVQKRATMQEMQ